MPEDASNHDLKWIKTSLQYAMELEYATIPFYLSSLFSIKSKDKTDHTYKAIYWVVVEEMSHLNIAANTLAAIGGRPNFKNMNIKYPVNGLPGGAEPDLHAGLAQLTKIQLDNFRRIERPQFLLKQVHKSEDYPTIAKFYDEILYAIDDNKDAIVTAVNSEGTSNQVLAQFDSIKKIKDNPIADIKYNVNKILEQGEGASSEDLYTEMHNMDSRKSHYAKFDEIYYEHEYKIPKLEFTPENEHTFFHGHVIKWPDVINTLAVPSDGYEKILAKDPDGIDVKHSISKFDAMLTTILSQLDHAWNGPETESENTVQSAVTNMNRLPSLASKITDHKIPCSPTTLQDIYKDEYEYLEKYSNLENPLYYAPRFYNNNAK